MPARLLAAIVLSLVSCSGGVPEGEQPVPAQQIPEDIAAALPPPDEALVLGLAGVPNPLLGDESAPAFGEVFLEIAGYGFNQFVPVFLTSESGEGGDYATYFVPTTSLPEALFGPISEELTCEGPHNPWAAADGILDVLLPGYLLAMDVPWNTPLEPSLAESRLEEFLQRCLEGDTSRAETVYSYDEPANNYATSLCCDSDPDSTFFLDNIARLADAAGDVLGAQTLIIEAPLPFFLPLVAEGWGIPQEMLETILSDFEAGLGATAPHADRYGFDVYPVDLTPSLSVIPEHVALAKQHAPQAEPIIVLQGFGMADMGIDNGTPGRSPTRDETRAMAFLALSAGARGVYWYGQSALQPSDPVWTDLREIGRDLRTLSGIFQLPPVEIPEHASVPGGVTLDLRDGGRARWALLVDREGAGGEIELPASSPARDALTGEIFPVEGGMITIDLGPYGSRMLAFLE